MATCQDALFVFVIWRRCLKVHCDWLKIYSLYVMYFYLTHFYWFHQLLDIENCVYSFTKW